MNATVRNLEAVIECTENQQIKTFQNGRYTNGIREVCMTLLTEGNVSMRKLPSVITTVCKKLTGCLPERLPSPALLSSRLMMEAKIIACKQVAKEMLTNIIPEGNTGSTLHQDATAFAHTHYEGMQATLQSGNNTTIGLQQEIGGESWTVYRHLWQIRIKRKVTYMQNLLQVITVRSGFCEWALQPTY